MTFFCLQTEEANSSLEKSSHDMHQTTDKAVEKVGDEIYEELASGIEEENPPAQQIRLELSGLNQQLEKQRRQHELYMDEEAAFLDAEVGR
jgi:hypothetical protein